MTTTHKQDTELSSLVWNEVIENLKAPLLNADFVLDWVRDNFSPGEVFPESELQTWALNNGFMEE